MSVLYAVSPKHEFRSVWLAAVGVDWPNNKVSTSGNTTQINKQKAELSGYLDNLAANNMNAVCYHVRPMADAFYKSNINLVPWSHYLTGYGKRGTDPGYDPLAYAVQEAHARGIELHAWVNPFRYEAQSMSHGANDPIRKYHPDWILDYKSTTKKGTILDPANPDVRAHIVAVVKDIVEHYDVDGIIFDDYFYPYGGTTTEDAASVTKWKPADMDVHDWRRENIDLLIKAVYDMIAASSRPWVRFGISPFGIWTTDASAAKKYDVTLPSGITGSNTYKDLGCNTLAWMDGGYVDYVSPQLYWPTTQTKQSYTKLSQWWSDIAKTMSDRQSGSKKVHFFSSQDVSEDRGSSTSEIGKQVDYNRQYDKLSAPGSIFFSYTDFVNRGMDDYLLANKFTAKSLPPAMDWKPTTTLAAPTNLKVSGKTLTWSHANAPRFTVYAYPKGTDKATALASSAYLLGITYAKSFDVSQVSNLANTTLAVCAYDRYGNEYEAGLYNAASTTPDNPTPSTPDMTFGSLKFYFQGGSMAVPADNDALWKAMWEAFKAEYPSLNYNSASFVTPVIEDQTLGTSETSIGRFLKNNFVDNTNNLNASSSDYTLWTTGIWKWLGDYFQTHASDLYAATAYSTTLNLSFETQGFLQKQAKLGYGNYPKYDWTAKGEPAAWQPAYIFGHEPTKANDAFLGWYNNPQGNGSPFTTLPTSGNVYACWKWGTTDIEAVEKSATVRLVPTFNGVEIFFEGEQPVKIYNINGMLLHHTTATCEYSATLEKGIYIVQVGNEVHKFVK